MNTFPFEPAQYIENGYISPEVSRQLSDYVDNCSLFVRVELHAWLDSVYREGLDIRTMAQVPQDLLRLLETGSYDSDYGEFENQHGNHDGTWDDNHKNIEDDDPADPFDDSDDSDTETDGSGISPDEVADSQSGDAFDDEEDDETTTGR